MWGIVALAPALFVLVLAAIFNDLTDSILVVVAIGFGISAVFFYRARVLDQEAVMRDRSSIVRKRGHSSSRGPHR